MAIVDTDLADVSNWDESGELIFKASAELTPEQKVAVSDIIKESLGGQHAQDQALRHGHLAKLLSLCIGRQEIGGPNGEPG